MIDVTDVAAIETSEASGLRSNDSNGLGFAGAPYVFLLGDLNRAVGWLVFYGIWKGRPSFVENLDKRLGRIVSLGALEWCSRIQ